MKEKEQIVAVVGRLRIFHAGNRQEQLGDTLRRWIEDPLRPSADKGNRYINPILNWLAAMALLTIFTFLFFGWVRL